MMRDTLVREADDLARELDLLVFELEQSPQVDEPAEERARLRRQVERLRVRMQALADRLAT